MFRKTILTFCLLITAAAISWAEVQIQILDFSQRKVRFTYEIEDNLEGNKTFLFPTGGFIHDSSRGPIQVESVYDVKANRELVYSVMRLEDTDNPQLRIEYREPVAPGQTKTMRVQVVVFLTPEQMGRDELGRYWFEYETGHHWEFVMPPNMYVISTSQPVTIYEKERTVFLQQVDDDVNKIDIVMRAR